MIVRVMQFLAVILTALAFAPAAAHLFVLPNKIGLDQDSYFTVQAIYRGWWLLGLAWAAALAANGTLAFLQRGRGALFWLSACAAAAMAGAFAVFLAWTEPANRATANWTVASSDWAELRARWEYSHAANAGLIFLALCCATLAVVTARAASCSPPAKPPPLAA